MRSGRHRRDRRSVARALQVKYLAERIEVDDSVVLQKIGQAIAPNRKWPTLAKPAGKNERPVGRVRGETYRLERQVVAMMLQFPEIISDIKDRQLVDHFADPLLAEVARGVVDHFDCDVAALVSRWEEPEKRALIARLSLDEQRWDSDGCMRLIRQFENSLQRRKEKALVKAIECR